MASFDSYLKSRPGHYQCPADCSRDVGGTGKQILVGYVIQLPSAVEVHERTFPGRELDCPQAAVPDVVKHAAGRGDVVRIELAFAEPKLVQRQAPNTSVQLNVLLNALVVCL